jgi:cytochrome c
MKGKVVGLGLAAVALLGCGPRPAPRPLSNDPATPQFYTDRVQPIFQAHCLRCHGGFNNRGGLNMRTQAGMRKGGKTGVVLVPGDPEKSLLVRLIRHEGPPDHPMPMPSKNAKLSDADITTVERWVKAGAIMPQDEVW